MNRFPEDMSFYHNRLIITKMNRFPEDMSFYHSNIMVLQNINDLYQPELESARSYIYDQYTKYLQIGSHYFFIDLRPMKPQVRAIIMEELIPKFSLVMKAHKAKKIKSTFPLTLLPGDGVEPNSENMYNLSTIYRQDQPSEKPGRLITYQTDDCCAFIIALTNQFIQEKNYLNAHTEKKYLLYLKN